MPGCSLHLCLHNKSGCAQITWQIQKACQEKENIPTATFKNETIVQGYLFGLTITNSACSEGSGNIPNDFSGSRT